MEILKIPNPILNTKCQEVTDFSGIPSLVDEMITTAKEAGNLAGIASNQVGLLQRFFVMNTDLTGENIPLWQAFVNPKIKRIESAGKSFLWEGCGSIPNIECLVERHNKIEITAQRITGEFFSMTLTGFLARVAQHEENHLNGILITSKARQRRFIK